MKFGFLLAVSLIYSIIASNAQFAPKLGVITDFGYNLTGFEKALQYNGSVGFRYERLLHNKLDVRIDAKVSATGRKRAVSTSRTCASCYVADYTEYNFLFLQVPLNLRYNFKDIEAGRFYATGGIMPSIIIKDRVEYHAPHPLPTQSDYIRTGQPEFTEYTAMSVYSLSWVHLNLAGGFEYALGKKYALQAEIQCYYTSMNVLEFADDMVTLGVGLAFLRK
jgi:hypothetical protein